MLYASIYIKYPEQVNPERQKINQKLPGAGKKRGWRVTNNSYEISFGRVMKMF